MDYLAYSMAVHVFNNRRLFEAFPHVFSASKCLVELRPIVIGCCLLHSHCVKYSVATVRTVFKDYATNLNHKILFVLSLLKENL